MKMPKSFESSPESRPGVGVEGMGQDAKGVTQAEGSPGACRGRPSQQTKWCLS